MKAIELNRYLNSQIKDLGEKTVDRVIYGDPDAEIKGIAVAWMPYRKTIQDAKSLGANLLVVHEPTFYDHRDLDGNMADIPETEAKKKIIDESGITIIRCHDVWDAFPEIGIPYAWGNFLELGEPVKSIRFYNLYEIPEQPAVAFAQKVAAKTATLGQPSVGFYGNPDRTVKTVGLGTGCISNPFKIYELGADLAISVDDVVRAWVAGEWCQDTGNPLLVVNHCVSEDPGMATLAGYLKETLPDIPVTHIRQKCTYTSVMP